MEIVKSIEEYPVGNLHIFPSLSIEPLNCSENFDNAFEATWFNKFDIFSM